MFRIWQALGEVLVSNKKPIGHLSYSSHDWLQQEPVWAIMLMAHKSFKVAHIWSTKFCIIENAEYIQVCPKGMTSAAFFSC